MSPSPAIQKAEAGQPDLGALKLRQHAAWSSGDYAVVGTTLQIVGEDLCEALDVRSGQKVLDVAAGNGNVTLAAARRWADGARQQSAFHAWARIRPRARAPKPAISTGGNASAIAPKGHCNRRNQVGFLPKGLTSTVEGRPKVSRRCATDPFPRSWRLNNVASDAARISPTVFTPAVVRAFRTLVENPTFSMGVSSGSSGAG